METIAIFGWTGCMTICSNLVQRQCGSCFCAPVFFIESGVEPHKLLHTSSIAHPEHMYLLVVITVSCKYWEQRRENRKSPILLWRLLLKMKFVKCGLFAWLQTHSSFLSMVCRAFSGRSVLFYYSLCPVYNTLIEFQENFFVLCNCFSVCCVLCSRLCLQSMG